MKVAVILSLLMAIILLSCEEPNPCRFLDVQPGMTVKEVKAIMGQPVYVSDYWERSIYFEYFCAGERIWIIFTDGYVTDVKKLSF